MPENTCQATFGPIGIQEAKLEKITANQLEARRNRLSRLLEDASLDAAAIVPGANFYYLTGVDFHLMERPTVLFILTDGTMHAVIPELERGKWKEAMPSVDTAFWQDSDGFDSAFERIGASIGNLRIGVEGQRMRVFEFEAIRRGLSNSSLSDAESVIARVRECKDPQEIELMERAISISERALARTVEMISAGMSERKIQGLLMSAMLDEGAEGIAFGSIVLAGGNSANPHGHSSERNKLHRGDALLFDFGASFGGYHADITRTFFCETTSERHKEIYQTVHEANELGRNIASPELTAHDVDERVTEVLRSSPFSDLIVHKTGHGLGLYVHEAPQVMVGNRTPLEDGNVITIEPGLYRFNEIGVRIEDDVLIEASGARSLTSFDRSLTLIG